MDEARVRDYLASGEGTGQLEAELARARDIGVTAVPTFVFEGRYAVSGAQPASTFLQVLEDVRARTSTDGSSSPVEPARGEDCADGVCAVPGSERD